MQKTILNENMAEQVGPDNYPLDWVDDSGYRGLTRNLALRLYVVKLAVAGKQFFLGNAYSQQVGARLYDYALWKFAGKMSRALHPNFPDDFKFITQEAIDANTPRLNELYAKIPFLRIADEQTPEAELRAARFNNTSQPTPDFYLTQLRRLKRIRLAASEDFVSVSDGMSKLDLRKLPDVYNKFSAVITALAARVKCLAELEETMESQHEYYRKVKNEKI